MTEQKNEVAVSTQNELGIALIPQLFNDIDFNGLSGAIENMALASGELTPEDKQMARGIIDEWNYSVIERLRERENDTHYFIQFFDSFNANLSMGHMTLEEFGPELAAKTSTESLYNKVIETQGKLRQHENDRPQKEVTDASATFEEKITKEKDYEAKFAIWHANHCKIQKAFTTSVGDWKRALNETPEVKDLIIAARKMLRGAGKMRQQANDKSQMAKLNISIASKTARDSLKDLLAFTSTI